MTAARPDPASASELTARLAAELGAGHVVTDAAVLAPRMIDNRKRWHGAVDCAVYPCSTAEVSAVMRIAREFGACVYVQGGNTSNVGGATPVAQERRGSGILICCDRMRRIEEIDAVNNTATVQCGVILEELQNAASEAGRLFAVSLASQGSCTVGGILATNAGGVHVLHYGNTRDQCLGLEVVLADGSVLDLLRGLRKDNTGYDLKDLFIGSEGTLGIITRAVLKLWPRPRQRIVAFISIAGIGHLEDVFQALEDAMGPSMTAFEVMHADTITHVSRVWPEVTRGLKLDAPWYALAEFSFFETPAGADVFSTGNDTLAGVLEPLFETGAVTDAVIGQSEAQNAALWRVRESIPDAHKATGGNVKHDISVPRSALASFVTTTNALLKERFEWIKPSVFGHFGDGNLHYNMAVADGLDQDLCFEHEEEIHRIVYAAVARHRGSVAAEHGIGRMKRQLLATVKSPVEYQTMRRIKALFDPDCRLNPGAVIGPAD